MGSKYATLFEPNVCYKACMNNDQVEFYTLRYAF